MELTEAALRNFHGRFDYAEKEAVIGDVVSALRSKSFEIGESYEIHHSVDGIIRVFIWAGAISSLAYRVGDMKMYLKKGS